MNSLCLSTLSKTKLIHAYYMGLLIVSSENASYDLENFMFSRHGIFVLVIPMLIKE